MKYLSAHFLTDLVNDLGVYMGIIAYDGPFDQGIDILIYIVGIWGYSIKQNIMVQMDSGENTHP